jgi:hypothetical protein
MVGNSLEGQGKFAGLIGYAAGGLKSRSVFVQIGPEGYGAWDSSLGTMFIGEQGETPDVPMSGMFL